MAASVPVIEWTHHAHAGRIRRPYGEGNTIDALVADQVRTKLLVEAVMGTFAQEVQIKLSKDRTEPIGVINLYGQVSALGTL